MWPEISVAHSEKRHELTLTGGEISQRISDSSLDQELFNLTALNLLRISDTTLDILPDGICKLVNLQSLLLHSNKLNSISPKVEDLVKLKLLDLSNNQLKEIPVDVSKLTQLTILNLSSNQLEKFPSLSQNSKLSVLDLANNKLEEFPDICSTELICLAEVKLNGNNITAIPNEINMLPSLKVLDLSSNRITAVPGEVSDVTKLKEINLKLNPIADKRLLKLIEQCRSKQVLDYIRQHCARKTGKAAPGKKGANKKGRQRDRTSEADAQETAAADETTTAAVHRLIISKTTEQNQPPNVIITNNVKSVRPFILCCAICNLRFDEQNFRRFIQMQTKLHETICEKRNSSTIATHDLNKLPPAPESGNRDLTYTARAPGELEIRPLGRGNTFTGAKLFDQLRAEAEALRKEKKRNTYSGVHRYLYLLEGKSLYPCVLDATQRVVSFPPITNSDDTKISLDTTSILVEVTSATSQEVCRKALDTLLKETLLLGVGGNTEDGLHHTLTVQRVKILDSEGNMKAVYPSRTDLNFDSDSSMIVVRDSN